jgi:hypothetical protein
MSWLVEIVAREKEPVRTNPLEVQFFTIQKYLIVKSISFFLNFV